MSYNSDHCLFFLFNTQEIFTIQQGQPLHNRYFFELSVICSNIPILSIKILFNWREDIIQSILIFIIFRMSFFDSLFMADATAAGKNITSGHFQIIVNGFQPVFNIHRLSDICTDVKGNTDKDVGLLRVYNSDKCQLLSTTCKIKDFTDSYGKYFFCFEHMFIPVESSGYGSCGIYNFILPVDYRLTELHIVDPFDNNKI